MLRNIGRAPLLVALATFAFCLLFAVYTGHAWEDWYITFKASKNLATGNGLGYMPGVRVHSFTSVIGTLIPAFLSWVTFNVSDDLTLWLFRIVNAGVMAGIALLLVACAIRWFAATLPAILLIVGTLYEAKAVDFAINGMETPYTMLGVALYFYFVSVRPVESLGLRLGLTWALLQYARPDGFVFAALLSFGLLAFYPNRRATVKMLARSVAVSLLVFLPWFLFAFWYYGNPIPHSVIAKSGLRPYGSVGIVVEAFHYLTSFVTFERSLADTLFLPANLFAISNLELSPINYVSRTLTFIASTLWLIPGIKPIGRVASLATLGFSLYLAAAVYQYASWYTPGLVLLAVIALAFGLDALMARLSARPQLAAATGRALVGLTLTFILAMTVAAAYEFRNAQRIIERGNRQQIGLWLKANAKSPRETVMMECLGYIGFYSELKTLDFPGMSSPEMVAAARDHWTGNFAPMIRHLQPDWIVLRPDELQAVWDQDSVFLKTHYEIARIFDVHPEVSKVPYLPFPEYLELDAVFYVIRKRPEGA
jgi:hypothetical protein